MFLHRHGALLSPSSFRASADRVHLYRLSGREEQNLEAQIRISEDFIFGGLDRIKEEIKKAE